MKFAIDSDSHSTAHLDDLRYGVGIAQRGWLTADDVINTWPLTKLRVRGRQTQAFLSPGAVQGHLPTTPPPLQDPRDHDVSVAKSRRS